MSPAELLAALDHLRDQVAREADAIWAEWRPLITHRRFLPGARNLAAYLALRRHDLSDLQPALTGLGLSSLGRSEAHVMASLDAVRAALRGILGQPASFPPPGRMQAGPRALRAAQARCFGPDVDGRSTRIMVTLPGEAAHDRALVRALIGAGMDCARINCAHDDAGSWRAMAALVRAEAKLAGRGCRVLMDIGGPKCRIETVHAADTPRLHRGERLVLARALAAARTEDPVVATINFPTLLDQLTPGQAVWINDGKLGTKVIAATAGRVVLEVTHARAKGEKLRVEKGVNFPDLELTLDPLTPKDLRDLDTVAEVADLVGFSFVQRPEDLARLHTELARRRPGRPMLPVVLKIETPLAVRNLPQLIVRAGAAGPVAVMIARGDMAVELGFARMSEIQEEIMWLCEAAAVPVVWATQVLETLVADGLPTRAEATDAAMAQRAECAMLNKGPFLPEAVMFLSDILRRMDRHQAKKTPRFGPLGSWPMEARPAVSHAA